MTFLRDLKLATRMLFKNPLFTAAAVLTLALGIGLNTAVFSAVYDLVLKPLPGAREPDELVQLFRSWPGITYGSNSIPHFFDVRDRSEEVFSGVAVWSIEAASATIGDEPEIFLGQVVSANYFQVMGVNAEAGRVFMQEEEGSGPGAHPVCLISQSLWETGFGGDPGAVGEVITVNGHPYEIIGVVPTEFRGVIPILQTDIWVPLMMAREFRPGTDYLQQRGNNHFQAIARLQPGVTPERAQEFLDALTLRFREEFPEEYQGAEMLIVPQSEVTLDPEMRSAALGLSGVMMGVVGLLLLIACVNVANLFLARAQDRKKEMGIRLSIGATRLRVVTQLLTESIVFAVLSGVAGLALAWVAVKGASQIHLPVDIPHSFDIAISTPVLFFSLVVALVVGILFGLAPALQATRPDLATAMKGEISAQGARASRTSRILVTGQMALSLVLLMSAGLFIQSLRASTTVEKGFDAENLLLAAMDPSLEGYTAEEGEIFYRELLSRVRALPGVTAAGLGEQLPLGFSASQTGVEIPGYDPSPDEQMAIDYNRVSPGYFAAMGIPLLRGREFQDEDFQEGAGVIIVNQRFAERFWPGEDPIGRQLRSAGVERRVVGVVPTGKYQSLREAPLAFQYLPLPQTRSFGAYLHVRSAGDPVLLTQSIREIVRELDPNLPLFDVKTMTSHLGIALMPARLAGILLGSFGLLGLILASVGIYGVMAYAVAQRTREIGIRVALGANRSEVTGLVLRQGSRLVLVGGAVGILGALGLRQAVRSLLFTGQGLDLLTFVGVPLLLGGIALLATYLPARKAASVDPVTALKHE